MENLNAEQVKKWLEICAEDTPYPDQSQALLDALALINQLTEDVERVRKQCGEIIVECDERDAERLKQVAELTEQSKKWEQAYDCIHSACLELSDKCDRLTEENERLQDLVKEVQEYNENWVADNGRLRGILLQFTDIVHKWGNKNGYDTSEISLVSILNEESEIKKQIEADALQKYKSAIIEYYSKPKYQPTKEHPIKHTQIEYLFAVLDQIAKEMEEGKNEGSFV